MEGNLADIDPELSRYLLRCTQSFRSALFVSNKNARRQINLGPTLKRFGVRGKGSFISLEMFVRCPEFVFALISHKTVHNFVICERSSPDDLIEGDSFKISSNCSQIPLKCGPLEC